jgi:hypothetical protein
LSPYSAKARAPWTPRLSSAVPASCPHGRADAPLQTHRRI